MDHLSTVSGETLIVRHIPLAHGQSVGWQLYSSASRPPRPRFLNLTHCTSLLSGGDRPKDELDDSNLSRSRRTSSEGHTVCSDENTDRSVSGQAFNAMREDSPLSSTHKSADRLPDKSTPRWHNPFLPDSEMMEDEEEDYDSDGDNLHKYREDSSFQLHGNSNGALNDTESLLPQRDQIMVSQYMDNSKHYKDDNQLENLNPAILGCQNHLDCTCTSKQQLWSDGGNYGNYILNRKPCKMSGHDQPKNLSKSDSFTETQTDEMSDSSCNSSDGVLVNFSVIYNKINNAVPDVPLDLPSPADLSPNRGSLSQDDFSPTPHWSPQGLNSNCNIQPLGTDASFEEFTPCPQSQAQLAVATQNYYKLVTCDLSSQSSPSLVWSSVTSNSEGQSQGSPSPPNQYFLFGQPEGDEVVGSKGSQGQLKHERKLEEEKAGARMSSSLKRMRKKGVHMKEHPEITPDHKCQSLEWTSHLLSQSANFSLEHSLAQRQGAAPHRQSCPDHLEMWAVLSASPHMQHITSFAQIAHRKKGDGDASCEKTMTEVHLSFESEPEGACASSPVCYSRPQRPTSLPIQPFVLQPLTGKQQTKALGSLLNQFISLKHSKSDQSKSTDKSVALPSYLEPSPLGRNSTFHPQAASSSDTCSTCTSSPVSLPLSLSHSEQHSSNEQRQTSAQETTMNPQQISSRPPNKRSSQIHISIQPPTDHADLPHPKQVAPPPLLSGLPLELSASSHQPSTPAITSVTSLISLTTFIPQSRDGKHPVCKQDAIKQLHTKGGHRNTATQMTEHRGVNCFAAKEQHNGDSFCSTDKPPEEFCLSPDAYSESLSINLLQKRGMLKAVSTAVELITAHFSSSRDPMEKLRLGNSSVCLSISHLVLGVLCPAIQDILRDGLRPYKLDLIVGQRRNHPWSVVEASCWPGPSTHSLNYSLISEVKKCSLLTNHCMRFNAFILGLLNFHALEFWIHHLHTCVEVVATHYHHWGFLAVTQGPACQPLFQELLLLLQPLSLLPFDLHLQAEPRLSSKPLIQSVNAPIQMKTLQEKEGLTDRTHQSPDRTWALRNKPSSLTVCYTHLKENPQVCVEGLSESPTPLERGMRPESKVQQSDCKPGWWLGQTPVTEGLMLSNSCEKVQGTGDDERGRSKTPMAQEDGLGVGLRWARLFGSGVGTQSTNTTQHTGTKSNRLPSKWLWLDGLKLDFFTNI